MSRRVPNPAADRATQNTATIKTLLKLEGNKTCADCKRNKHPRWASWNLGIFICIRCSGIHRGMGTHISRVKSVDLDAWTDEQLQSVVQWGNSRANKYWEAKLAPGHVPSEAKIENFIKTKYDSKRWVMDGGKPDPSTLDAEGDDDVPLSVIQEKGILAQQRAASTSSQTSHTPRKSQSLDLFGDDNPPAPRPKTTTPSAITRAPPPSKTSAAPPKATKPGESLLGLDFLGNPPAAPGRSVSESSSMQSSGPSRPDLKQSILSLYASGPRPQPQAQHSQSGSISGAQASQQSNFGGMNDAFSGLSFGATSPPPIQQTSVSKPSASSGLGTASTPSTTSQVSPGWGGGGFFDSSPKPTQSNHQPQKQRTFSNSSFGAFDSAPAPAPAPKAAAAPQAQPSAALGDMFDFGLPSQPVVNKPAVVSPSQDPSSVFNLSKPTPTSSSTSQLKPTRKTAVADPFGGNDVWGTPEGSSTSFAAPKPAPSFATTKAAPVTAPPNDNGWGNSSTATGGFGNASFQPGPPKVTADEDFGGWSSAAPVSPVAPVPAPKASKPAASGNFGGGDDLFGNVWG